LKPKKIVRIMEAHSGLSGLIVENTTVKNKEEVSVEFDGMWASSLTDSTLRGKPDIEAVDLTSRLKIKSHDRIGIVVPSYELGLKSI